MKELWVRRVVIADDHVLDSGEIASPEKAAFWRQKLVEEQEIWDGKWNGWKPSPINPYEAKRRETVIWQTNIAKDQVFSDLRENQRLQDVT